MCTLAVNGFALASTAKKLGYVPGSEAESTVERVWQILAFHNSHPPWNSQFYVIGVSYWDLIQPAFMFMVGVAMPYSYASRKRRGDSETAVTVHAFVRAVVLVLLGVFLQTKNSGFDTNQLFTNVLAQIGLGYFFVFLVMKPAIRVQIVIGMVVLALYTAWMSIYPIIDALPDHAVESIQDFSVMTAFAKPYAFGINAAAQTDLTILGWLLDRPDIEPHRGGYATLNFVPSAVTMLLGVIVGKLLRSDLDGDAKLKRLMLGGAVSLAIAVVLSFTICPIIKRIWTPAWTLYSGAYVLWILAALYWCIDLVGWRRWTYPLVVVGANSLAMYLMSMLIKGWVAQRLEIYFGDQIFASQYGASIQALAVFAVLWLLCLYLYRNKLFLRI